ncbi:hypothetical protein B0H66DRAFT_629129 [Apodospora peruviana]|uniref:Uncharacterized protein n=1 Tax=Apodospora peruviana TaxID=516989 RepID=A0AAE0HV04_9PEZI|nr:hypothetical protein B0H66DRAFT_629129 [Apodospora peruviana]
MLGNFKTSPKYIKLLAVSLQKHILFSTHHSIIPSPPPFTPSIPVLLFKNAAHSNLFLGLAATASAVDLYLYTGNCFNSAGIVCTNINPNTCCGGSNVNIFPQVGFRAIPATWNLECRGHAGGFCNQIRQVQRASGGRDLCLGSGPFSGSGYGFTSKKKRFAQPTEEGCAAEDVGGCTASQKPDLLFLADGTQYKISDLDDADIDGLVKLAASGANATDVPAEFGALEIKK